MPTILVCRTCESRADAELAENQRELAAVGMLEQACEQCGKPTFWVLAERSRRSERRQADRRTDDRRQHKVPVAAEHRSGVERRQKVLRSKERREKR